MHSNNRILFWGSKFCLCPSLSTSLMSFSLSHCWIKSKVNGCQKTQPRLRFGNKQISCTIKQNIKLQICRNGKVKEQNYKRKQSREVQIKSLRIT